MPPVPDASVVNNVTNLPAASNVNIKKPTALNVNMKNVMMSGKQSSPHTHARDWNSEVSKTWIIPQNQNTPFKLLFDDDLADDIINYSNIKGALLSSAPKKNRNKTPSTTPPQKALAVQFS